MYQTGIFDHIFNCTMWMLGENINPIIIHNTHSNHLSRFHCAYHQL